MADQVLAKYPVGADLPDLWVTWRRSDRSLIPFGSEPYDFELTLADELDLATAVLTKTVGFISSDADPNLVIQWSSSGDFNTLTAGVYAGEIVATRQSDSRERIMPLRIELTRRPGT